MHLYQPPFRLAILDMYQGYPNEGMRCIEDIVRLYDDKISYQIFDVRGKAEVPDTSFDIYISTGGPGHPLDFDGIWDVKYFSLIDQLWNHNLNPLNSRKFIFCICHSFQMACHHFGIGEITKRKSMSFGTFPCYLTDEGAKDPILAGLSNPFSIADFRNFQVINPNLKRLEELGAEILALEKIRPHISYQRAVMGVRFSDEFFAVQFHPEADAAGMVQHFQKEEKLKHIINEYGKAKYATMMHDLRHPEKIERTNKTILPNFLDKAVAVLESHFALAN